MTVQQAGCRQRQRFSDLIRRFLLSWLLAAAVEYLLLLPGARWLGDTDGLAQMSPVRMAAVTAAGMLLLSGASTRVDTAKWERWGIFGLCGVLMTAAIRYSYGRSFWWACLVLLVLVGVYGVYGWNGTEPAPAQPGRTRRWVLWSAAAVSGAFFLFASVWTVSRVYTLSTPTYDMGLFSQMFYYMSKAGVPLTTLERDGLLSHFAVHVSPIYYLMLPFYALIPTPATIQVLQAAVLTSAVIPLWKLGRRHGLADWQRLLLCVVLLAYPAFGGGVSYDIHENCFLTPLLLWLFYAVDAGSIPGIAVSGALTLLVKEDAAVYVAVIALWMVVSALVRWERRPLRQLLTGLILLAGSLAWFFLVTGYLASSGDGVMTYRYENFLYNGSSSLVTVVLAVLLNPMKLVYECVDPEKLSYLALTLLPLLGLPLLTRRYERFLLLIPYVLVNLMSDYPYQHDVFFQYSFGSTAFLLYLTVVNLQDLPKASLRGASLALAAVVSIGCFAGVIAPKAVEYPRRLARSSGYYQRIQSTLAQIPEGASVSATTFYTTALSRRELLYDVGYASWEHILQTDYVVMDPRYPDFYENYATEQGSDGAQWFMELLERHGYERWLEPDSTLVIYRRAAAPAAS